jgi:hypothetical protein
MAVEAPTKKTSEVPDVVEEDYDVLGGIWDSIVKSSCGANTGSGGKGFGKGNDCASSSNDRRKQRQGQVKTGDPITVDMKDGEWRPHTRNITFYADDLDEFDPSEPPESLNIKGTKEEKTALGVGPTFGLTQNGYRYREEETGVDVYVLYGGRPAKKKSLSMWSVVKAESAFGANTGPGGLKDRSLMKSVCGANTGRDGRGFGEDNTCWEIARYGDQLGDLPISRPASKEKEETESGKRKTGVAVVPFKSLKVDAERFQYKIEGVGSGGVTSQFADIDYNPELAGIYYVWHDTEDGETYVVNGHHRYELGQRSDYEGETAIRYIDRETAGEARAFGALINIAQGQGTALDAAKFGRDMDLRGDDLIGYFEDHSISLKGKVAENAVDLSNLSDHTFRELAYGRLEEKHARAIGSELRITSDMNEDERAAIWDVQNKIAKRIESKKSLTESMVREMSIIAGSAPRRSVTTQSLFGDDEEMEILFEDRAAVQAHVRSELGKQARGFGAVASNKRESMLRDSGVGDVDSGMAAKLEQQTRQALETFDKEVRFRGGVGSKINEILNQAATEYRDANAPQKRRIKQETTGRIREILATVS